MASPNFALNDLERVYLQDQTAFGVIPHSGGTATVGNNNATRFISAVLNNDVPTMERPDKTGTFSQLAGVKGRVGANWSMEWSMAGHGTAGTVPDANVILKAAFGQAAAITPGVAVTYTLSDSLLSFVKWVFRQPASVMQRVAWACCVTELEWEFGGNFGIMRASGEAAYVLNSEEFATASATEKAGLTTFPSEPSAPATNGAAVIGFTGSLSIDSQSIAELLSGRIRYSTGLSMVRNTFGSFMGTGLQRGRRRVTFEGQFYDSDSAAIKNVRAKAKAKTPVSVNPTIGVIPGNIHNLLLRNVQLVEPSISEGDFRFVADLPASPANATSTSVRDEFEYGIS